MIFENNNSGNTGFKELIVVYYITHVQYHIIVLMGNNSNSTYLPKNDDDTVFVRYQTYFAHSRTSKSNLYEQQAARISRIIIIPAFYT